MLGVNLSIFAESLTGIAVPVGVSMAAIAASIVTVVGGLAYVFATNEDVRQSFSEAVSSIGTGLGNIANVILPCLKEAWDGLLKILAPLGTFLEEEFTSIWQDMLNPALSYIGETVLPKLSKALESLWNNVLAPLGEFIGSVLAPIIQIISDMLSIFWQNVIVPLADAIGRILGASIEGIIDIFGRLTEIIHPVIEVMQFLWNKVLAPIVNYLWKVFKPMFEDVFKAIGGVVDGLADTFSGLITFITGVFTGDWEKAWQGVQDIFKGIFNGLISIVEGVINFIIDGLNGFLGTFDGIVTSIGEVIGIDISIPEIPTISIPRFENGGYVTSGQIFMARENGINEMVGRIGNQNAVVNNDQIVAGITAGVQAGMNVDEQISLMRMMIELLRDIREKDPGIVFDTKEGLEALRERSERNGFSFT